MCSAFAAVLMPVSASAVSVDVYVKTTTLLPAATTTGSGAPLSNASTSTSTCAPLQVLSFRTHVYDNELNAIDVSIADPSYVAIAAQVGDNPIPFQLINRHLETPGHLGLQVNTPSIPMTEDAHLDLVLVSANPGAPICVATVAINLAATGNNSGSPAASGSGAAAYHPGVKKTTSAGSTKGKLSVSQGWGVGSASGMAQVPFMVHVKSKLDSACSTTRGTSRLWAVLLGIYLLVVAAAILAQPEGVPDSRSVTLLGAAILLPLVLLFGIWTVSRMCQAGSWVPLIAALIALVGFIAVFRNDPRFAKFVLLFSIPEN
jgi:hypothetical protein